MAMTTVFQSFAGDGATARAAASETPKATEFINFEPIRFPPPLPFIFIALGKNRRALKHGQPWLGARPSGSTE
jgi:hypothetical protein